jgi:hypothetical protein
MLSVSATGITSQKTQLFSKFFRRDKIEKKGHVRYHFKDAATEGGLSQLILKQAKALSLRRQIKRKNSKSLEFLGRLML